MKDIVAYEMSFQLLFPGIVCEGSSANEFDNAVKIMELREEMSKDSYRDLMDYLSGYLDHEGPEAADEFMNHVGEKRINQCAFEACCCLRRKGFITLTKVREHISHLLDSNELLEFYCALEDEKTLVVSENCTS